MFSEENEYLDEYEYVALKGVSQVVALKELIANGDEIDLSKRKWCLIDDWFNKPEYGMSLLDDFFGACVLKGISMAKEYWVVLRMYAYYLSDLNPYMIYDVESAKAACDKFHDDRYACESMIETFIDDAWFDIFELFECDASNTLTDNVMKSFFKTALGFTVFEKAVVYVHNDIDVRHLGRELASSSFYKDNVIELLEVVQPGDLDPIARPEYDWTVGILD